MGVVRETTVLVGGTEGVMVSNGVIAVGVATALGPRVLHCGFVDGPNLLAELPELEQDVGGETWRIVGGHRLWHAPEAKPRTYTLDGAPVALDKVEGGVGVTAVADAASGIAKRLEVRLAEDTPVVYVRHALRNDGPWPVTLAPWALTVMAPGGTAVAPLPPAGSHDEQLQPTGGLALWAYTDLTDTRWQIGARLVMLHHDPARSSPQKLGFFPADWLAYAVHGQLFVKQFPVDPTATYPDRSSSAELFANDHFVELESLGPLVRLAPGETAVHEETWQLFKDLSLPTNEEEVLDYLQPFIK